MKGWKWESSPAALAAWFVRGGALVLRPAALATEGTQDFIGAPLPASNKSERSDFQHDDFKARVRRRRAGLQLFALAFLLAAGFSAQAAEKFCSQPPYNGVLDGDVLGTPPTQITIDTDCTFQNWPQSNPLTSTINFQTNDPSVYLIVFDNVWYDGNMACANIPHKLWVVNSPEGAFTGACQNIMIPAETIDKQAPAATASIGVPFTYTLTLPAMEYPEGAPSANTLGNVVLEDDLTATGADLTYVSHNVYWKGGSPLTATEYTFSDGGGKNLTFNLPDVPAGQQIVIEITVVLDDTPTNTALTSFINTAKWFFSRSIDVNEDGVITPDEFFEPLPGEWGISEPMTIVEPNFWVTKESDQTALNLGIPAQFTIDAQNIGGGAAWYATITDLLPDTATAGMCPTTAPGLTAQIFAADGVTPVSGPLAEGTDYDLFYDPAACELRLIMTSAAAVVEPSEHLIITYVSELDGDTTDDGVSLTNVAGATRWFSGETPPIDATYATREYIESLSNGTEGVDDHEDSYSVTTALHGYYFEKIAANLESGANPAATAAPGDTLRYKLRLFNIDQTIDNIAISDVLDPTKFDLTTFGMVTDLAALGATHSFDQATGLLTISGNGSPLNLVPPAELVIEFNITLKAPLANGTQVENQAFLSADSGFTVQSDDPYDAYGVASPDVEDDPATTTIDEGDEYPTVVTIQAPGALSKVNPEKTTATIGEQFTYTITVPETTVDVPLYDLRIEDTLPTTVDLRFVSARLVSDGRSLSNTNTDASKLVIEDTNTGIDVPSGGQAVIEITVALENTLKNQSSVLFNNSASYTYNRANDNDGTQTVGGGASTLDMRVVEPHIAAITKSVDNNTPTSGEIVRYSVTLDASSGDDFSDVFDVTLIDHLDPGLAYEGNPTVTAGSGVSADNTIGEPDVTGDGSTAAPQTLVWSLNDGIADIDIAEGESITISYDVRVLDGVLAGQALTNRVVAQWTGIDGANGFERNGTDGIGGLNDYITPEVAAPVTTPNISATIAKERTGDTYGAGDENVRIGEIVEYTLTLMVPEGTLGNLQLVDTLPQGLQFEGTVTVNGNTGPPFAAAAPFSHAEITEANISGDAALGSTTVTWNLGNLTNQPNDGLSDEFIIVYRARVLNDVFEHTQLTMPLNNVVNMSYDTAAGSVTQSDTDTLITALQPQLTVTKNSDPASGSTIAAGATVTYTVDIQNTGTAPAYDTVLEDVLPAGLDAATLSTASITLVNAGTALASFAPAYNAATRTATWDFDSGVADGYTIPAGETLHVVYTIQADADLGQGLTLTNEAQVTAYYSFDDEAVPTSGTITGVREVYGPTNTASTTLYTGALPTKALVSPAPTDPEAPIGEEVIYRITVPGTVSTAALYDIEITDTLDENLEYIGVTVTGGGIGVTDNYSTTAPSLMDIAIEQIPAGQQVVIELRARVRNELTAQQGVDIDNTVAYTYAYTSGGTTQPALTSAENVTVNIVEPHITTINKIADDTTPTAGEIVRYSVTLAAGGGTDLSDVFDVAITDTLSAGLVYEGNPTVTAGSGVSADNTIGEPDITGDGSTAAPQTLVWSLDAGNADIDIAEGESITISYDVRVLDGVLAGQALTNRVVAQWTGIDGANGFERNGTDGIGGLNDYITPEVAAPVTTPNISATIAKERTGDTYGAGDENVRIGDIVEYTLTLMVPEGTLGNLQLVDTLPQGLQFEGTVTVNGNTGPPFAAAAPFSHAEITEANISGDAALGSTTVTWNLGNLTNQPNDGLSDEFIIVYRARVLNDVFEHTQFTIPLNNVVNMSYDTAAGSVTQSDTDTLITALQPQLTVSKTAAPTGGDTVIDAGELITYTIDVINTGTAPAYDTVVQDILPLGLRQAEVSTISITLADTATGTTTATLASFGPTSYDPTSGVAIWDFDRDGADAYTIAAGQTLRITYTAQADADLAPGLTLTNTAQATAYYSFDDEAVPMADTVTGVREIYGPSNTDSTTLQSPQPAALSKATTWTTVSIGEQFTYTITVPTTAQTTALNDVRIIDDLSASAADISFVSVAKVSGSQPWNPVNTGDAKHLVIEDTTNGIDIPAGEQAVIEITVVLEDTPTNVSELVFNNAASYTFNAVDDDSTTQTDGLPGISGDTTIVGPDTVTLEKSGPATMRVGLPGTFTIDIRNTGTAPAWDLTITDQLPNPTQGGMCDAAPTNITAQIFEADGTTPVSPILTRDTDYVAAFTGEPTCTLTITMQSATAAIGAGQRLIVTYDASLDTDSVGGTSLTNVAAATEWFSGDTAGAGATGSSRTYTGTLGDGTVGTLDEQDAHTLTTELPVLLFQKSVVNVTSGQDPGASARPGDTLRYTLHVENVSPVDLPDFSIIDELDGLNASPIFAPGSLALISVPAGADSSNTDANGGANGTGLLDVRNLSLDAQGGTNTSLDIVLEVTLVPVIDSGTVVLNQAHLTSYGVPLGDSDDPNVNGVDDPDIAGDENPTETLIESVPAFEIWKTSEDLSGDPLLAGDTLRYTITLKNVGTENSINTLLTDQIPANTTYVDGSTTLNGVVVADPATGVSPLQDGMLINAPEDTTPGFMRADASAITSNMATITFDVVINSNAVDGTIIANQAILNPEGAGSGAAPEELSDDPNTSTVDDPTRDIVGSLPLVDARKTVQIQVDSGSPGIVDPGDVLRYTITISNGGAVDATNVVFTDEVPANTTYVPDSVLLNGLPVGQPDGGASPLVAGIPVSSSDLTPPLPAPGSGIISAGGVAVITFDVQVDPAIPTGTPISNQGTVSGENIADEPTDADGIDSNGDQPTVIVVGPAQQLSITKEVFVIGGGEAEAGSTLEYVIRVTNIGTVAATNVIVTDDLDDPVSGQLSYVNGSGTLNGTAAGVTYAAPILTADYSGIYGDLPPDATATLRFRAQIADGLAIGTTVTNIAQVGWNSPPQSATASVSIDVGGVPGSATLNGRAWHDPNFNKVADINEGALVGWTVEFYRNGRVEGTTVTDENGFYQFSGVAPNDTTGEQYELRFIAPGAAATTASMGHADSGFTNGPQRISAIVAASGSSLQNLNLPITPNGVVYNSVTRTPVAGATVTMLQGVTSEPLPSVCFDDPAQQGQVTADGGYYKFDINFVDPACAAGADYIVNVVPPATGYLGPTSQIIPPSSDSSTAAYSVPLCKDDAVLSTPDHCEAQTSELAPALGVPAGTAGTTYHLHLQLDKNRIPGESQLFNNHLPLDPELDGAVAITKTAAKVNVTRGQMVPYTITLRNSLAVTLTDIDLIDTFPPGFKYVKGSAQVDGVANEPRLEGGRLIWGSLELVPNTEYRIRLLFTVGSGVAEGEYVNRAQLFNTVTGGAASGEATATVRVVPDPNVDCTDIIGKVFDDKNVNGYQDEGERGLPGVRLATARGLLVKTDEHGRFHITCAMVPNQDRGSNFILKLDDRTLPTGYRVTTENPRVQRATRGKMMKFDFGAAVHRVVRLDLADGVFEPNSTEMRLQWKPRMELLLSELRKGPSILRVTYLADIEKEGLVKDRLESVKREIVRLWQEENCCYRLTVESEIFWRRGGPPQR